MTSQEPAVLTRARNGVGEIVLNRPAQRNALNTEMCVALLTAAERMEADDTVRAVVVRASGRVFCAGADVKERRDMTADDVRARRLKAFAAYDALERLSKPSIAMVQGPVVGSGGEIAASCDFIIASEHATFRYPESAGGTIGATQRLPWIVGLPRAKELLFTGRTLSAADAALWGLVNRVVSAADLEAVVLDLAAAIATAPVRAMRLTKRCLDQRGADARRSALAAEILAIEELLSSDGWSAALAPLEKKRGDVP